MASVLSAAAPPRGRSNFDWTPFVWFGLLLGVCYAPILIALVKNWNDDADMGHGFFVPVIAGYIAWQKRDQLAGLTARPNWWGLAIVIYGAF